MIDAFLKIKGIKGECIDKTYLSKGVIQLLECEVNGEDMAQDESGNPTGEAISSASVWVGDDGFINQGPPVPAPITMIAPPVSTTDPETKPEPPKAPEMVWPFTFDITKLADTASSALFLKFCQYKVLSKENANASGSFIPSAKLWVRKAAGGTAFVYFVWEFRKLQVTSFKWSGASDGNVTESISFRFASCQMSYTAQDSTGTQKGQPVFSPWDLQSNTKTVTALPDTEVLS